MARKKTQDTPATPATPMTGLEGRKTVRHAPPLVHQSTQDQANKIKDQGVLPGEGVKMEPEKPKRDQKAVCLIRGSTEYCDAVNEAANHYQMSVATLYGTALVVYLRKLGYDRELPMRTTHMKGD